MKPQGAYQYHANGVHKRSKLRMMRERELAYAKSIREAEREAKRARKVAA